ncbi:hypothetical protein AB1Y20_017005 [Prymnesium parvum]|uniref:non-specific serine/threonine protein kinase n=1 Tax=Prymnesium parvum TaxID=97485 RepID=A0AB34IC31_PRYPA
MTADLPRLVLLLLTLAIASAAVLCALLLRRRAPRRATGSTVCAGILQKDEPWAQTASLMREIFSSLGAGGADAPLARTDDAAAAALVEARPHILVISVRVDSAGVPTGSTSFTAASVRPPPPPLDLPIAAPPPHAFRTPLASQMRAEGALLPAAELGRAIHRAYEERLRMICSDGVLLVDQPAAEGELRRRLAVAAAASPRADAPTEEPADSSFSSSLASASFLTRSLANCCDSLDEEGSPPPGVLRTAAAREVLWEEGGAPPCRDAVDAAVLDTSVLLALPTPVRMSMLSHFCCGGAERVLAQMTAARASGDDFMHFAHMLLGDALTAGAVLLSEEIGKFVAAPAISRVEPLRAAIAATSKAMVLVRTSSASPHPPPPDAEEPTPFASAIKRLLQKCPPDVSTKVAQVAADAGACDEAAQAGVALAVANLLVDELQSRDKWVRSLQRGQSKLRHVLRRCTSRMRGLKDQSAEGGEVDGAAELSEELAEAQQPQGSAELAEQRILIIEDSTVQARVMSEMCEEVGYRPTICASGEEALERIQQEKRAFPLILCDVHLPGISGVDVLKKLREAGQSNSAIVMMSSNQTVPIVEACVVAGADSYILKPPRLEEIRAMWGFVVRRRKMRQEAVQKQASLAHCIQLCEKFEGKLQGNMAALLNEKLADDLRDVTGTLGEVDDDEEEEYDPSPELQAAIELSASRLLQELHQQDGTPLSEPPSRRSTPFASRNGSVSQSLHEKGEPCDGSRRPSRRSTPTRTRSRAASPLASPRAAAASPPPPAESREPSVMRARCGSTHLEAPPCGARLRRRGSAAACVEAPPRAPQADEAAACVEAPPQADEAAAAGGGGGERVLCRLCEREVPREDMWHHAAACVAARKLADETTHAEEEASALIRTLQEAEVRLMGTLLSAAVRQHHRISSQLHGLVQIAQSLLDVHEAHATLPSRLARLARLSRKLVCLIGRCEGRSFFHSSAMLLKGILAQKMHALQHVISLSPSDQQVIEKWQIGVSLGDFTLLRCLGSGGFSQVWLSRKTSTGDMYAIKAVSKRNLRKQDVGVAVEAAILMRHTCAFLVRGFYSFESARHHYLAIEFMPGGDISTLLLCCGFLDDSSARFYLSEVFAGLFYLHDAGVVHRDVKPANVLIAATGHVKLADFGLSTSRRGSRRGGTLPYTAPEVLRGEPPTDAVDYYSAGVLLYEMIVGDHPFSGGGTPDAMLQAIETSDVDMRGVLDPELRDLIAQLLRPQPDGRAHRAEVYAHAWLAGVPWGRLLEQPPPFVPQLQHESDTRYFEEAALDAPSSHDFNDLLSGSLHEESESSSKAARSRQGESNVSINHLLALNA